MNEWKVKDINEGHKLFKNYNSLYLYRMALAKNIIIYIREFLPK